MTGRRADLARTRLARASGVGDGDVPARLAVGRDDRLLRPVAPGLPRRRHARRGQDDLRAHRRRRAARPPARRPDHDRGARPSTSSCSGPRRPRGRASRSTRRTPRARARPRRTTSASPSPTPASRSTRWRCGSAPSDFKTLVILDEVHHAGDALSWGEGVREAFQPAHPAAGADRHAVPLRRQPDPVRHLRARATTACRARSPTSPTATPTRSPTTSCGRCCSWPTPARCSGAPAPATRSPPASASR